MPKVPARPRAVNPRPSTRQIVRKAMSRARSKAEMLGHLDDVHREIRRTPGLRGASTAWWILDCLRSAVCSGRSWRNGFETTRAKLLAQLERRWPEGAPQLRSFREGLFLVAERSPVLVLDGHRVELYLWPQTRGSDGGGKRGKKPTGAGDSPKHDTTKSASVLPTPIGNAPAGESGDQTLTFSGWLRAAGGGWGGRAAHLLQRHGTTGGSVRDLARHLLRRDRGQPAARGYRLQTRRPGPAVLPAMRRRGRAPYTPGEIEGLAAALQRMAARGLVVEREGGWALPALKTHPELQRRGLHERPAGDVPSERMVAALTRAGAERAEDLSRAEAVALQRHLWAQRAAGPRKQRGVQPQDLAADDDPRIRAFADLVDATWPGQRVAYEERELDRLRRVIAEIDALDRDPDWAVLLAVPLARGAAPGSPAAYLAAVLERGMLERERTPSAEIEKARAAMARVGAAAVSCGVAAAGATAAMSDLGDKLSELEAQEDGDPEPTNPWLPTPRDIISDEMIKDGLAEEIAGWTPTVPALEHPLAPGAATIWGLDPATGKTRHTAEEAVARRRENELAKQRQAEERGRALRSKRLALLRTAASKWGPKAQYDLEMSGGLLSSILDLASKVSDEDWEWAMSATNRENPVAHIRYFARALEGRARRVLETTPEQRDNSERRYHQDQARTMVRRAHKLGIPIPRSLAGSKGSR